MIHDTQYSKTKFFEEFGHLLVKVSDDDVETGDLQLFCPEENHIAQEYKNKGYLIASVFDGGDNEDIVILNDDCGEQFHKIGFLVLRTTKNS